MKKQHYLIIILFLVPLLIGYGINYLTGQGLVDGNRNILELVDTLLSVWGYLGVVYWFGLGLVLKKSFGDSPKEAFIYVLVPIVLVVIFVITIPMENSIGFWISRLIQDFSLGTMWLTRILTRLLPMTMNTYVFVGFALLLISVLLTLGYRWPSKRI